MGNDKIKRIRSQKFFSELNRVNFTQNQKGNPSDLNEKKALKSSITNIEKGARYTIQLFSVYGQSNTSLNEPQSCLIEEITNIAVLTTSILMQYYFEKEQPLVIVVINKIGGINPRSFEIRTTLGCVMGSRKNTLIKNIPDAFGEVLNVAAKKIGNSEDIFILRLNINPNGRINFSEIKNKIVLHMMNNSRSPIYNSECISDQGQFNEIKIPWGLVANGIILYFINNRKKVITKYKPTLKN